jgi:cellulose synthase/poly-beta-1,6-N-acetylglucosamine synthase-like glycosyltransferase
MTESRLDVARAVATGARLAATRRRRLSATSRPSLTPLLVVFLASLTVSLLWFPHAVQPGTLSWYTTVVWTLPILLSAQGLVGALLTARGTAPEASQPPTFQRVETPLIVVVPTIGRHDTVPALERVLESFFEHLAASFPRLRVDVVIEEGCEAVDRIMDLIAKYPDGRALTVPADYTTPNETRFKARANHYAAELRRREGEARDDVWVLHMDDDTGVGPDTAEGVATFIQEQQARGPAGLHLAQGVLCYPREHASNGLTWLADAVRPGCDLSFFAAATGSGTPRIGLHGELLLIRASIEAEIGWDYGARAIVEDAEFALRFAERHPGRSAWFPARSYGASPATVADFVRQRERWVWGLLELVMNGAIPLRRRLLMLMNVSLWCLSPIQHPLVVLLLALALGDFDTAPVTALLLPIWSLNVAFFAWLYWEGLKVNTRASALPQRRPREVLALVALIPVFALWEVVGSLRGLVRALRRSESSFTVIAKPR